MYVKLHKNLLHVKKFANFFYKETKKFEKAFNIKNYPKN